MSPNSSAISLSGSTDASSVSPTYAHPRSSFMYSLIFLAENDLIHDERKKALCRHTEMRMWWIWVTWTRTHIRHIRVYSNPLLHRH